eukprot:2329105-Amphidinium_carterae.1
MTRQPKNMYFLQCMQTVKIADSIAMCFVLNAEATDPKLLMKVNFATQTTQEIYLAIIYISIYVLPIYESTLSMSKPSAVTTYVDAGPRRELHQPPP